MYHVRQTADVVEVCRSLVADFTFEIESVYSFEPLPRVG